MSKQDRKQKVKVAWIAFAGAVIIAIIGLIGTFAGKAQQSTPESVTSIQISGSDVSGSIVGRDQIQITHIHGATSEFI